jgi:hypothetical protein
MTTLVDALIITLGLDPSQFIKGQKEAESSLKKTKETAVSHGKEIERSMKSASDGVGKLVTAFLGLAAVFTGGKALKEFVADSTRTDASVGRLSANLRMNSREVQAWGGAVESLGGSSAEAQTALRGLSDSFQAITTLGDASLLPILSRIGSEGGKQINWAKPLHESLKDLNVDFYNLYQKDPQHEGFLSRQLGIPDNLNNLLIQPPAIVQKILDAQAKYAASPADIDTAQKRQSAWQILTIASERLGTAIETQLTPTFVRLATALQDFIDKHRDDVLAFFQKITDAIQNAPWAKWFDDLKEFAKRVDFIVSSTIGWKTALEGLVAIKFLDWITPVAGQFGLIAASIAYLVGAGPALTALFAAGGVLAAGGALAAALYPQSANAAEDERARQERYGQGAGRGATPGPSGATPASRTPPGTTPARGVSTEGQLRARLACLVAGREGLGLVVPGRQQLAAAGQRRQLLLQLDNIVQSII